LGTKARLRAAAAADRRNMTSWVLKVLLDALEADEKRRRVVSGVSSK
jgi:hypothetical protein